MANKVPPARDFAPAWLKIPSYQPPPQHASRRIGSSAKTASRHNSLDHSTPPPPHLRRPHSRHDFRDIPYNKINTTHNHLEPSCIEPQSSLCNDIITSDNFNKEFPSLQGTQDPPAAPLNGGVWEKPCPVLAGGANPVRKVQLARRTSSGDSSPLDTSLLKSSAVANNNNNHNKPGFVSTPLQPSKTSLAKKVSGGNGGNLLKPSNTPKKGAAGGVVLDMVLVKTPRTKVNKSEFLRALGRAPPKSDPPPPPQPSPPPQPQQQQQQQQPEKKEEEVVPQAAEPPILSSSVEAEQRLLRQMGWKEDFSDDDFYAPWTEDELKEIGVLKQKLKKSERKKPLNGGHEASNKVVSPRPQQTWTQEACDSSDSSSSE